MYPTNSLFHGRVQRYYLYRAVCAIELAITTRSNHSVNCSLSPVLPQHQEHGVVAAAVNQPAVDEKWLK